MQRAARLAVFGWIVATAIWTVFAVRVFWFSHGLDPTPPRDFDYYYDAARIGLTYGWDHLYDLELQYSAYRSIRPSWTFDWQTVFVSLPPMAWLTVPLALMPHALAYWIWVAITIVAYYALGAAAIPGSALVRVGVLLSGVWIHAVMVNLQMGQNSLPVALAMVAAALLVERRHQTAAGILVAIGVTLKPQVAIAVPVALLVGGYWRAALSCGIAGALLAVASAVSLGPHGMAQLRTDLAFEQGHWENVVWSPAILVGLGPAATALQVGGVATAVIAAAIAGRAAGLDQRRRVDVVIAAGLLGSLAAFSYHHESDWCAVVAAGWLWARGERSLWLVPFLMVGIVLLALVAPLGIGPAVAYTLASEVVLLAAAARRLSWPRRLRQAGAPA